MHTPVNTLSPFATHWQPIPSGRSYNLWDSRETQRWYHQLHEEVSRLTELASGTKHTPAGCCRVSGLQHQQRPSHWHNPHPKNHHGFLLLHCQGQYLTITLHSPLIDSNPTLKALTVRLEQHPLHKAQSKLQDTAQTWITPLTFPACPLITSFLRPETYTYNHGLTTVQCQRHHHNLAERYVQFIQEIYSLASGSPSGYHQSAYSYSFARPRRLILFKLRLEYENTHACLRMGLFYCLWRFVIMTLHLHLLHYKRYVSGQRISESGN